jgi:hypothetical protein
MGVLTLLAAGAIALGVVQSPTSTDLQVHNGAGETLGASKVVGHFTASYLGADVVSFAYAPGAATEVARGPHGEVKARRSLSGSKAIGVLQPVQSLLSITNFTQQGSLFVSSEPVADLVPAAERSAVSGTYRTSVRLLGGYVVSVHLAINAVEGGQKVAETIDYHLTRVGSWEAT